MSATPASRVAVPIELGDRSYDILIGTGLLDDPKSFDGLPAAACAAIVTNPTVAPLYAARLQTALGARYARVLVIELPDRRAAKDWTSLNTRVDALPAAGLGCKTSV